MFRRPHHIEPQLPTARVILAVKNFAAVRGVSHIGLGVTATNTVKVLRRNGIFAEAWATQTADELRQKLVDADKHAADRGLLHVSHVIVSAPSWVQPDDFKDLCLTWPDIEFVQLNHSGCAYLSIDKFGIRNIKQAIDLELSIHNMRVAANNPRVADWFSRTFGFKALLLPNLYDCATFVEPYTPKTAFDPIRIGSFGAGRPWKNQLTAAEAAVQLARQLGTNLEFYVNSKRPDGGERMIESRAELFDNLRGTKLIEVPWEPWPRFRHTCGSMHLLFQPSFDETFNVVTADGIAAGVPSVTTSSIEWTPRNWWCDPCDPGSLVRVGLSLLHDKYAVEDGRRALRDYTANGIAVWKRYLTGESQTL